jgi:hypothetical protein
MDPLDDGDAAFRVGVPCMGQGIRIGQLVGSVAHDSEREQDFRRTVMLVMSCSTAIRTFALCMQSLDLVLIGWDIGSLSLCVDNAA